MPRAARAHIEVFDVAGRRVRRLDLGQLRAGPQVLLWDGRDDHGRNVAAGVYAIRMISDAGNVGTRVVLLRE
jgi:flagellar hook assembly protein FlgD